MHRPTSARLDDMSAEPNMFVSLKSQRIIVEEIPFDVLIYRLEEDTSWTLEVVTQDSTSVVWGQFFEDDGAALEEARSSIQEEGPTAFQNGGSNVIPFPR
jgi:hypothetical protein